MCPGCDIAIDSHESLGSQPPLVGLIRDAEVVAAGSVAVPESDDEGPLYVARRKIYPQRVKGRFRTIKWIVLCITLGIYYGLPFVRWDRGLNAPNQAVLIDFPNSRFYFFFVEIWPQEVYYLT